MSFRTRRVTMSTPLYMLFYFFLLKYLLLLICDINDGYVLVLAIVLGLLQLVPMLLEAKKSRRITRFLSIVYGVWIWMSLMFLIDIIAIYLLGSFIQLPKSVIMLMLAVVLVLGIYNYYKAHKLVVNEKTLELNNLSSDIKIVHLSDIHFGSLRHRQVIKQVAGKLKELEDTCELAIISGDLADGSSIVEEDDFMLLSEVEMPIIFTPGNHDYYPGIENVIKAAKKAGIIVLDNDRFESENLNVYGLTYSFDDIEMPTAYELKESICPNKINIINYHVPYNWNEFCDLGFDIQLSGHTHGGQFHPMICFANKMYDYNRGLFKNSSGKYLHVTTGVGSMDIPMRWGTDSEIVVLKLKSN